MEDMLEYIPPWTFMVAAFVFGSLWGSFANVMIVRWPKELSVLRPASHCFSCQTPIRFYDNIPLLSFLLLRGRCRHCKAVFSPRYFVIELLMALLSVAVVRLTLLNSPPTVAYGLAEYFIYFAFVWALVTMAIIDLNTFLLPDVLTLPGIVVGLLANIFVLGHDWIDPVVGAAVSYAGLSLLFVHGYKLLTGHQGMGEGDPKLLAMIGAFLGLKGSLFALFAGAFQGLFVGSIMVLYWRRSGRGPTLPSDAPETPIEPALDSDDPEPVIMEERASEADTRFRKAKVPFGPFLALGAIEYYLIGGDIVRMYEGLVLKLYSLFS